jgi:hypothetical protein
VPGGKVTTAKSSNRVSLLDPATGEITEMEGPDYKTPEAVAFWKPVLQEVKARLEKRGLGQAMMIGMCGDRPATKEDVTMFSACLPGTKWAMSSHPDMRGWNVSGSGALVGYNTAVYLALFPPPTKLTWDAKRQAGWRLGAKTDAFPRFGCWTAGYPLSPKYSPLPMYRIFTEACLLANLSGLGRTGADFWPVLGNEAVRPGIKGTTSICGRYVESCWDQLNLDRATEALLAPGPDGAVSTERYENIREGIQDCEARIFIEKAILAGSLDPALAKKCQDLLDDRQWIIRAACMNSIGLRWGAGGWFEGSGFSGLTEKLYAAAAEVAAKLGAK